MISTALLALLSVQFNNPPGRVDPLSVADSPAGFVMMDAIVGSQTRIICVSKNLPRRCPPGEAVRVEDVPKFGQFIAEWDARDPRTVNVYVFGGRVVTCSPIDQALGVRISLRQLPIAEMGDADIWCPAKIARFAHAPDVCGTGDAGEVIR